MAEIAHSVYLTAPIVQREGVAVGPRNPSKWVQLETWIKPRVVAAMPQHLKKQLQQRGVQGVRDEVQDILYQLMKTCHPGTPDEKQAVISQLQSPNACSRPDTALNELQRFWAAARRCHALKMQFPDVSILYTAMTSIFTAVLSRVMTI